MPYIFKHKITNMELVSARDELSAEDALKYLSNLSIIEFDWGKCNYYILTSYYDIIDNKVIYWDTQRKVDEGVIVITNKQKVVDDKIVDKTQEELLKEGIITQEQIDYEIRKEIFRNKKIHIKVDIETSSTNSSLIALRNYCKDNPTIETYSTIENDIVYNHACMNYLYTKHYNAIKSIEGVMIETLDNDDISKYIKK